MNPISMRDFTREMVSLGASGSLGYHFDVTIDDQDVTPENFDGFSDEQIKRAVFHGVALKNGRPHKQERRA